MNFDVFHPRSIRCGRGRVAESGDWAQNQGTRCLVCTGSTPERVSPLLNSLQREGIQYEVIPSSGEPTFDAVRQALEIARRFAPDSIAAMGGGSAIDLGKAVSMLLTHEGDPLDYAEVVGRGQSFTHAGLPVLAIPTTAGAGAEMTRNAVLREPNHGVKVSLRSPHMVPQHVILDADTLRGVPPDVMAATGMDALCQLIEAFVCIRSTPWTDALCRAGIPLAIRHLADACLDSGHDVAREQMMLAACWSGMALTNAGLGAVHGFAAAAGGILDAPHGWICARLLAPVTRANVAKLREQEDAGDILKKYRELAEWMYDDSSAAPEKAADWLDRLTQELPLANRCIPAKHEIKIVQDTIRSSSIKGNPVSFSATELQAIWRNGTNKPAEKQGDRHES